MSDPTLPEDGRVKEGGWGANHDPDEWKVVNMTDDPTLFKIVDNNDVNVADRFRVRDNAERFIEFHKFKQAECQEGQRWDYLKKVCTPGGGGGEEPGDILPLNPDGTLTLPGGQAVRVIGDLVESIYGNQFIRSEKAGTFEATAPGSRANVVAQGFIVIPQGMVGMKSDGKDEGTIILKDNHGPGGNMNKQYKVQFVYKRGGDVKGIELHREHEHPGTFELKGVEYDNQPEIAAGQKLEFISSCQDTNDDGVRLRMHYKDPVTGDWKRLFDHVDYGDGSRGQCYRGKSGVQDGTRVDGSVNEEINKDAHVKPLTERPNNIRGKVIRTTVLTSQQKGILAKLANSGIWAREIESDTSNLHDEIDDPLSFGPKQE
jgi:hypothetical protein